jgi:hypothetical protein
MKTLEKLINEQVYMVADHNTNRFNFIGLITLSEDAFGDAVNTAENVAEWSLTENLPEDVQRAVDVMVENGVVLDDFTGVVTFDYDLTYYLLTW